MAKITGPKYQGSLSVDLSIIKDDLIDVAAGGLKGARGEQPGFESVQKELAGAMAPYGARANIPPQVYESFLVRTARLALLRDKELELAKLLEIVTETRVTTENDREGDISIIARAAQDTADRERDPGIAAPFEQTITYNRQSAEKGVHTKKKNAEAKAEATKPPAAPPIPRPPAS